MIQLFSWPLSPAPPSPPTPAATANSGVIVRHPVRPSAGRMTERLRRTGSPACAGDDGWERGLIDLQRAKSMPPARFRRLAARMAPELCMKLSPLDAEGAGKAGCPSHPWPVCIGRKHTVVTTGIAGIIRPSLRDGVTAYTRSPWRPGFLATIAGVMRSIIANLTPASGRRDHATSPSASGALVSSTVRVHRIPLQRS